MTTVLLHSVGLDGLSFQFLTSPELADAVRYGCLWHGERPNPAEPLTVESMAADLAENTDGALDLVGVSMGGQIAQRFAMRWPERVRSLLLTSGANPTKAELDVMEFAGPGREAEMVLQRGTEAVIDWALARWLTPKALADPSHAGVRYVRKRLLDNTTEQFAAGWTALAARRPSLEEQVDFISMPTTVLHPINDHVTLESRQALANALPNARLRISNGPHLVHLEEPEEFETAVLDHLDWVGSTEATR